MLKLENWVDLFKFNKELLDDDYNPGQKAVFKNKLKSDDGSNELNYTLKEGHPDANQQSKVATELKFKSDTNGLIIEGIIKNDGSYTAECKSDVLEKQAGVKGLQSFIYFYGFTKPTDKEAGTKVGIDYGNDKLKFKQTYDIKEKIAEALLTYQCCKRYQFGAQLVYNVNAGKLTNYNAGAVWEPRDNNLVGVKHESIDKDSIKIGKFLFYYFHKASEWNTIGAEFTFNWATKEIGGRAGINHKINNDNSLKVKVDGEGNVGHVFKHQLTKNITASATSSVQALDILSGKQQVPKLGLQFDLKC